MTSDLAGLAPGPIGLEDGAQVLHVGLERVGGGLRWFGAPEDLEEAIGRHHFIGVDDEGRQQQAGLGARKLDGPAVDDDLERSEHPHLHAQPSHISGAFQCGSSRLPVGRGESSDEEPPDRKAR